jgi:hypothetical protein
MILVFILQHQDNSPPSQCLPVSTCLSKPRIRSIENYPRSSISLSLQETTSPSCSSPLAAPTSSSSIYLHSPTEQHGSILLPSSEFPENSEEVSSKDVPTKRRKKQSSTEIHGKDSLKKFKYK